MKSAFSPASSGSAWFDVKYYKLNLRISAAAFRLSGVAGITGICNQNNPQYLTLDLANAMHIDSVIVGRKAAKFMQQASLFNLALDSSYRRGDIITADVYYGGTPVASGFGSFQFGWHSGTPWVWSLSEPYGARDWWPCKDDPSDKADSADIFITCDTAYMAGSNGRLAGVRFNSDGTKTTHWQERYPIATYLVSVAVTNFATFSDWFRYGASDSMEILNYVIPESLASARSQLGVTTGALEIFSGLFGLYPFIHEKYGHSQFGSGAMEHQTMTSTAGFSEETIIHELAHQWFGDMITCRSWSHLWLNEGFATYCTALYKEMKYGEASYREFINLQMDGAKKADGSLFVLDTADVRQLFYSYRVYSKGAAVLHMLRHVLGDSVFFKSMYAYANEPSLKYGTAATQDFRSICERTSGEDLGYFFNEWIYGENYPHYIYTWRVSDSAGTQWLTLTINQTTGTLNPAFFKMPVDIRLKGAGWDSAVTIFNDSPEQTFSFAVRQSVDSVQLDPGSWILKAVTEEPLPGAGWSLYQNYPNPFNSTTIVRYSVPNRAKVVLSVYDILGRRVSTLFRGVQMLGTYESTWDAGKFPSGVYFYRLEAVSANYPGTRFTRVKPMIILR